MPQLKPALETSAGGSLAASAKCISDMAVTILGSIRVVLTWPALDLIAGYSVTSKKYWRTFVEI